MQVDLLNYLDKKNIILNLKGKSKKKVLSNIVDYLISVKKIDKRYRKEILKALIQREEMGSTGIGGGIALPHARLEFVDDIILSIGISSGGVNFDSLDGGTVYVVALLLSNHKEAGTHLKMLALLARILRDKYFVENLKEAKTEDEVFLLVKKQASLIQ